ncbi:hypothetical protein BCR43DRAFT_270176 [Syncephalastrum racemosum]|uniref:Bromo domain-containing protein n=1 Tax=Syncephalastrum racemosum TaxID=13706 RepID=A0A1X2HBX0_SYNRA|nr:hypothetical protein BCR43DRAFT_270176 [Syncephalastrum racemosum]
MDAPEWSVLEKLILAQAVYKLGEDNWAQIARRLRQHPMLKHREPDFFSQKSCSLQYYIMLKDLEAEKRQNPTPLAQDMPPVIKLARQLYAQRVDELKTMIKADEDQFMDIVLEINDIRAGRWDDKFKAMLEKEGVDLNNTAKSTTASPTATAARLEKEPVEEPAAPPENAPAEVTGVSAEVGQGKPDNSATAAQEVPGTTATKETQDTQGEPMEMTPTTTSPPATTTLTEAEPAVSQAETGISVPVVEPMESHPEPVEAPLDEVHHYKPTAEHISASTTVTPPATLSASTPASIAAVQHGETDIAAPPAVETDIGMDQSQPSVLTSQPTVSEPSPEPTVSQEQGETAPPSEVSTPVNKEEEVPERKRRHSAGPEGEEEKEEGITKRQKTGESEPTSPAAAAAPPAPLKMEPAEETHKETEHAPPDLLPSEYGSPEATHGPTPSPAILREGSESVTGSESNAPTPTSLSSEKRRNRDEERQQKSWQKITNSLWREISNHKNGAMFMNPIKESTAPMYYDVIKYPMDLKTIKNRIKDGYIRTTVEFERDVVLMLCNSLMYNKEGTEIFQMASEMLDDVTKQMKDFKTEDTNSSASSHTRKASTTAKDRRKSVAD